MTIEATGTPRAQNTGNPEKNEGDGFNGTEDEARGGDLSGEDDHNDGEQEKSVGRRRQLRGKSRGRRRQP